VHFTHYVNRRILMILAALVLPGGFVALFGAWLVRAASRTERGRKWLDFAREKVRFGRRPAEPIPAFATVRQAA
jgi:hypothetical protein